MLSSYSTKDNTISGLRFLDGRLQTAHSTIYYENGKALGRGVEWRDVPSITSANP